MKARGIGVPNATGVALGCPNAPGTESPQDIDPEGVAQMPRGFYDPFRVGRVEGQLFPGAFAPGCPINPLRERYLDLRSCRLMDFNAQLPAQNTKCLFQLVQP